MLDERLTAKENDELLDVDVYDIHEIFESEKDAINYICEAIDKDFDEVLEEFQLDDTVNYSLDELTHYSFIKLSSGRVVAIEMY